MMKLIGPILFVVLLTGPANAITQQITSGFFGGDSPFGDASYDLRGNGFEIGPGLNSAVFQPPLLSGQSSQTFQVLGGALFPPPPVPELLMLTFLSEPISLAGVPNPGDQLNPTTFTMTGALFVDLHNDPAFPNPQKVADLVGQGLLTVRNNSQLPLFIEFVFDYNFTVPEPATVLLLGGGLIALAGTVLLRRRAAERDH